MSHLSSSKLNILLIDSDEVIHLIWDKGRLNFHENYSVDQHGFDQFHVFLEGDSNTPFALVLDVIEEDFRNETVAHVTGADRQAMMQRKLAHIFRTTPYRTSRVVGRETTGRKDDHILLTGLTKPDVIEPWLSRVLNNQVPLLAITSAAYVMELFAKSLGFGQEAHLLMANQEANSGLRQTYLQNGRVIFSRLTPTSVSEGDDFSELVLEQCDQTRKYLERIKQLPYETHLKVHVFTAEKFSDETSTERENLSYQYHVISDMPLSKRINLVDSSPGAIAYSMISALNKKGVPNVYAPAKARRFAFIKQAKSVMYTASALAVLGSVVAVGPTVLDATAKWEQEYEVTQRTEPLLSEYQTLTERFPETPIPSGQMELVVETANTILDQVSYPQEMLAIISEGLLEAPQLLISSIEWELVANEQEVVEENYGEALSEVQVLQRAIVSGQTLLVTTVNGLVQTEGSFREATAQINLFADAIAQHSNLTVSTLSLPMDVGLNRSVAATLDGSGARGEFSIEIRREVTSEN